MEKCDFSNKQWSMVRSMHIEKFEDVVVVMIDVSKHNGEGEFCDKGGTAVLLAKVESSDVAHVRVPIHPTDLDHGQAPIDGGAPQVPVPVVSKDNGQTPDNKGRRAQKVCRVQVLKAGGDHVAEAVPGSIDDDKVETNPRMSANFR